MFGILKAFLLKIGLAKLSENDKAMAEARANICVECPEFSTSGVMGMLDAVTGNQIEILKGATCKKCGCNLDAKVLNRAVKCPLGKWEESDKLFNENG